MKCRHSQLTRFNVIKPHVPSTQNRERRGFKSDSGSLGLYLQHIFKNQPCLLRESGETARNLHAHRLIVPFVISAHIFTFTETTLTLYTNQRAVVGLSW